jgi:hypothetical protein
MDVTQFDNSNPCGKLENPPNKMDLLDFPIWPPINFIDNETL